MNKSHWTRPEVDEYRKLHRLPFYFNREDANIVVPPIVISTDSESNPDSKYIPNFAHPICWVILGIILALFILLFISGLNHHYSD